MVNKIKGAADKVKRLDSCFAALADPTRRQIIQELASGQVSVTLLAANRRVTVAAILKHLSVLERAGLIRTEKVGRVRQCVLTPKPMRDAADWLSFYRALWDAKLDRLERFLSQSQGTRR
jgi:DNA-binding transcriptional ArsR family regulator